jgi:hypothetical protein
VSQKSLCNTHLQYVFSDDLQIFFEDIVWFCTRQLITRVKYLDVGTDRQTDTTSVNYKHIYENNQQAALYRLIYYSKSALHVSGYVLAHHQEHVTVYTVSGSVHPSCCGLVSWMSWNSIRYCKYSHALLMMGENIARKNVEQTLNTKLIYIVHLLGYFHS